jgi:hypothetical protein
VLVVVDTYAVEARSDGNDYAESVAALNRAVTDIFARFLADIRAR